MNEPHAAAITRATPSPPAPAEGPRGLDAVFRPRSIAVIGASRDVDSIGGQIFHNLLSHGFEGPVYPVNPRSPVVQSIHAYARVADLPDPVDLAIVVVPAALVLETLEACGKKGVRAAVVISAGFKETGAAGARLERAAVEITRRYGMRLVGPNCLGVLNTEPAVRMDATFAPPYPPAGSVAFSSQSGALGLAILEYASQLHVGISHFISVGNKADVSGNDLLEYWEHDPGTRVILLYLESFGNPRRFLEVARRVARRKPIVAVKSGRTRAGMRAASSHTGSLAGADTAVSALCLQAGVIRTDTLEELFDVAMLLNSQPVPRGHRVAVLTNAGGPGIMASDALESRGLEVPSLADATVSALHAFLPPEASTRNPVDMIASATPGNYEKAVRLLLEDPGVDALLVVYVPPTPTGANEVARAIVRANEAVKTERRARGETLKTVLSCFMGTHGVPEGLRSLQEAHVPSYVFPESAAIALAHAVGYGRWLGAAEGRVPQFTDIDRDGAAAIVGAATRRAKPDGAVWLDAGEVAGLLAAYGVRMPGAARATNAAEAARAARSLGFPVALKLVSERITHKSDVGGVVLGLRDEAAVRDAFATIERNLEQRGQRAEMEGVLVQPMVEGGIEVIVGITRDPAFGPLVMFGLGGVQVELLKDVVFRVTPLTDLDAHQMVHGVRGARLLDGYRGAPPGDAPALEEVLLRLSQLAGDHPAIVEMDLNPLRVMEPGSGCLALDARIAVRAI
jgi:acetyl coenzyme A synthetase (ADP forming)-like protein